MGTEIERKFLLANESWRDSVNRSVTMRQGYLGSSEHSSVRVRVEGGSARLNIKSATLGISRTEFDYPIPLDDARAMLETLCGGKSVSKTRHYVRHGEHEWEIDEFTGENAGLVVAEIELHAADEAFDKPAWLGQEVSHDRRFYNVSLIDHPYARW